MKINDFDIFLAQTASCVKNDASNKKTRSRRAVTARSLVVYVNASADKLALRAVSRYVHEVFCGPALRAKWTHGFLRV